MKATVFGMNCKEIIISPVLPYYPKKTNLSTYGGNGTYVIYGSINDCFKQTY